MADILLINGPNLNMLGVREPGVYGQSTLTDIEQLCETVLMESGHTSDCFQSNAEHELIERIHLARNENVGLIVINPAAYTHSSIAIRDALSAVAIPFIEVHISNIYQRESFRQHSYFSDQAIGVVSGFGIFGYEMAMRAAVNFLAKKP